MGAIPPRNHEDEEMTKRNDQWEVTFTVFPAVLAESPMAMVIPIKIQFRDGDNQHRPVAAEEDFDSLFDDSASIADILGGEYRSGGCADPDPRLGVQGEAYLVYFNGGPINAEILKAAIKATATGKPHVMKGRHRFAPGQKDILTFKGKAVTANSDLHPGDLLMQAQAMRTSEEPVAPSKEVEGMIHAALDTARFGDEMRQAATAPTVKVKLKKGAEWAKVHHCDVHTFLEIEDGDGAVMTANRGETPSADDQGWPAGPMLQVESGMTIWSRKAA